MRTLAAVLVAGLLLVTPTLASEEAYRLQQEASGLMKRALADDEPGPLYEQAAARLQEARGLLERELRAQAGDAALEDQLATVNAMLFWCHKNTPVKAGAQRAPEPEPAPLAAGQTRERAAQDLFDEAAAFEREHGDDTLLVLTRWFEVAERFVGTEWSIKAQRRSLELQRELLAAAREAAAVPPASELEQTIARAEAQLAEGGVLVVFADVSRALEGAPDDPRLLWLRGRALHAMGRPDGAALDFTRLIETRPEGPGLPTVLELTHRRGLAYLAAKDWEAATTDLRSVLASSAAGAALKEEVELLFGKHHGDVRGGPHGDEFQDAVPLGRRVKEVRLRVRRDPNWGPVMSGVQVLWDGVKGQAHGSQGDAGHAVKLKKDEYVVAISGKHGQVIDSIVIHTNKGEYGPFGGRGGPNAFRIDAPPGTEICGFRGKAGLNFDSVGVIVRTRLPER